MADTPRLWNDEWFFYCKRLRVFLVPSLRNTTDFKSTLVWFLSTYLMLCWPESCPTLWDPMDCSPPGSSVHWILQARILEWVAISFSSESSQPRDQIQVSRITGGFFTIWATREAPTYLTLEENVLGCVSCSPVHLWWLVSFQKKENAM